MSYEAVCWALYRAPWLITEAGDPDTTARFVLIARAERADAKGRDTYASPEDVARSTGFDERTVRKADQRLEAAGLLIRDGVSRYGTVVWHCAVTVERSVEERSPVDDRNERRRAAAATRQQRYRDRLKAAAESAQGIEGDVSSKIDVTLSGDVSNAVEKRDVTPFESVSNALSTPRTTLLTTHLNHPGTTPGGAPPPDPRRRPPTSSSATSKRKSLTDPLTEAQDQQGESLPRARGAPPPDEHLAPVVDLSTWRAS